MKIERVDEKTIKCFLTNEELEEYHIDYKDFLLRSDRAKEMVREIVEMAMQEVNFQPPQYAFDLQIMMMPEQGLLLTFSEKDPFEGKDLMQLMEYLKCMRDLLNVAREKIGLPPIGTEQGAQADQAAQIAQNKTRKGPEFAIYEFDSIQGIMEYASAVPKTLRVDSALYKFNESYFLIMSKGSASDDRYIKACVQVLEFGSMYSSDTETLDYLREHGECLIAEKALKKLRID
ncbi:MAG: adaptor protein MecA [Lachnospiraceae bacterium]|nr:adaptor protein MecA [Lachnospiraceae bacterium]